MAITTTFSQASLLVLFTLFLKYEAAIPHTGLSMTTDPPIQASMFPADFVWGSSTSAIQVEGAWNISGKGVGSWDLWSTIPGHVDDDSTTATTNDYYHHYREDIELLANTGFKAYKFSVSWTRILPSGEGEVSQEGIDFYNKILDVTEELGIDAYVTLHHFDVPQALQDKYNGWLNTSMIDVFKNFADICFKNFGNRVKKWITINEMAAQAIGGWGADGHFPPGRCTNRSECTYGNSSVEPYVVMHIMLQAHAAAAALYKAEYKPTQRGQIGLSVIATWYEPYTTSQADRAAAKRCMIFQIGWVLDPLFKGDYPQVMRSVLGDRLPTFTVAQRRQLVNTVDFIGLNHYFVYWVVDIPYPLPVSDTSPIQDYLASMSSSASVNMTGGTDLMIFTPECSFGLAKTIDFTSARYPDADIYITENGYDDLSSATDLVDGTRDHDRIEYFDSYLRTLLRTIRQVPRVKGYFPWSLTDNWEWNYGYTNRYGLYYVDRSTLKRYPKDSAAWFSRVMKGELTSVQ